MDTKTNYIIAGNFASHLSWLSFFKILSKIISFMSTIYLARILNKEGFGIYSYALAFLPFFQAFISEGFRVAGVQLIASYKREESKFSLFELSSKVLLLRIVFAVITYFFLLLFIEITYKSHTTQNFLELFFLLIIIYAFDTQWILQGLEKMKIIGIADFTRQVVFFISVFFLIKKIEDFLFLPYVSIIAEGSVIFIVFFYILIKLFSISHKPIKLKNILPDKQFTAYFLKHSFPISLSFIFIVLINNLGIILLDFHQGPEKVASYTTA